MVQVYDLSDPTEENLRSPKVGRFTLSSYNGAHTAFPVLGMPIAEFARDATGSTRDFVVVTNEEQANECLEPREMVWFVDVTVEKRPVSVATYGASEQPGNFCTRRGRFGTHSSNENMTPNSGRHGGDRQTLREASRRRTLRRGRSNQQR